MAETISLAIAGILVILGIFMAFVPMLPALSYMFLVSLVFAMVGGFKALSGKELLVLLFITIVSVVIDHTSGALGAKYGGAHTKSLLWGILGAIVGTFVFPAFGSFIGLFASVLVAELCYKKTKEKALKAASGALIGSAVGVIANICLSIAFVILFFFFALS